jgi:hypothetical protein
MPIIRKYHGCVHFLLVLRQLQTTQNVFAFATGLIYVLAQSATWKTRRFSSYLTPENGMEPTPQTRF